MDPTDHGLGVTEVQAVLDGRHSYDDVDENTQLAVRNAWKARMTAALASLDLEREFTALGRGWVELDDAGEVHTRRPDGRV